MALAQMTPMMARWKEVKEAHQDCIVFYRLGDFYEMFFEDAETGSKVLGLTLTGRDCGLEKRAPMCGIPFHAASGYIKKLIDKGFRVAICEQLTAPQKGKNLVERDVTKIITCGTYNDDTFLDETKNNFVAAVYTLGETCYISWADITTGEFFATACKTENKDNILAMINAREIIESGGHYAYAFNSATALACIFRHFKITSTEIFDLKKEDKLVNSSGALLEYLLLTQKQALPNIERIRVIKNNDFMMLDKTARENLELNNPYRQPTQKKGSLLWILDATQTAMGARVLVSWLNSPLQNTQAINERLDAVETFIENNITARNLKTHLSKISDISRLCGKVATKSVLPRDFISLAKSLEQFKDVKNTLKDTEGLISKLDNEIILLPELQALITRALDDAPPTKLDNGGYIKAGYNTKLDELRSAEKLGKTWLSKLEEKERTECNLKEIKIGYNRITGYYFEIPKRLSSQVPYRFIRKATTVNTERYITEELKELETKIIGASSSAIELEAKLFSELREAVLEHLTSLQRTAIAVATLDVLQSFAFIAITNNYVRPKINSEGIIELIDARHPVVEKLIGERNYIANDSHLKSEQQSTMLITGPNMAGKSTYMRMVAHITIMAHIGCFVPAKSANIALTDRIFTRIGASDSLLTGQSTFLVEMSECANIIFNATKSSLILLDEVGRGTSTEDGHALASAIITYITNKIGANTMFATHIHQLTTLANTNPRIKNYKALTEQIDNEIVFLHKIEQGIETNSFGIDVAKMAGLPKEIIDDARKLYNNTNNDY